MSRLPVEDILHDLVRTLGESTSCVLQAPPGAGKTTLVPIALLSAPWLSNRRIIMLEPRRLAARMAAARMAFLLGEEVGETVGYRVRLDSRISRKTRIEVVTEGVLTRMLQADPSLLGAGVVIFDEFHERSVHADLGLALAIEMQQALRPDLRILVMSATLDVQAVARLLGNAPVLSSEGRQYPVDTVYDDEGGDDRSLDRRVSAAVRGALDAGEGDVLVFLPGAGEIRRTQGRLEGASLPAGVDVLPLFGNLSRGDQDRAVAPSPPGRRKVVLATSIAETSLTIEGVRMVIDSGWMRVPRFSPRNGMTRLETIRVTRDAADQRRGRAGRLGPGVCLRLWTRFQDDHLRDRRSPEILEVDLASLVLELAAWGARDPAALAWLDPPPAPAYEQARELLAYLGALNREGAVTGHGREMASLGLHPRLAHMVLKAKESGCGSLGCDLAALLSERDILHGEDAFRDADIRLRLDLLRRSRDRRASSDRNVHHGTLRRVRRESDHLRKRLGISGRDPRPGSAGLLLALAYPDRIAARRPESDDRFAMRNGQGARLGGPQVLSGSSYLSIAETDGRSRESLIHQAAPVSREEIETHFRDQITVEQEIFWDDEAAAVRAVERERLGAIVLAERPLADPPEEAVLGCLLDAVGERGIGFLSRSKTAEQVRDRLRFLHRHDSSWPDVSDEALLRALPDWLAPHLHGIRRKDQLDRVELSEALLNLVGWEKRRLLDALAPTHIEVPSGSRIRIDYSDPEAPVLAVRLQEVFGMTETPRILGGRVPLTMHLLSPAHRPVQVTQDLESFWRGTYFDVRRDLRGRYPKHHWPDDPLEAEATRSGRRRRA